jgi:ABC-type antimicrobial peptide transport system permease subunit
MAGKKGSAAVAVLVVIVLVMAIYWILGLAGRECSRDTDCGSDRYCGSDFECHDYKIVYKSVNNYDLVIPAIIIGLAIVIGAYVLRRRI